MLDANGQPQFGITTCNVPVGDRAFVETYLENRLGRITRGFDRVSSLLDPGRWPNPDIPSRQLLWILTLVCFQFMGDYWLRHVRPDFTGDFAAGIDRGVRSLVEMCVGADVGQWSEFARERLRLPIRQRGCGLRESTDRRYGQYLGAFVQSVLPLLDRTDDTGCHLPGRLHVPAIVDLFGEGSFNHPIESPWDTLLTSSRPAGDLVSGLRDTWSHLTSSFQDVAAEAQSSDDSLLLNQDVARAGFFPDGTVPPSVTKAVTVELEGARCLDLDRRIKGSLTRTDFERWAWEASNDKMASTWIHSPPDRLGYIEDPLFPMVYASHLGQPCPAMAPVVGRFFGKKGTRLDPYGANLAASVELPGQGHRILHNRLQSIVRSMMSVGGILSDKEAVNFLVNKVGEPYISRYVHHVSRHPNARNSPYAIVPDILAYNFPVGRQTVRDSGATSSAEAFFEVKTYTACPTRYNHNNDMTRPADRRGREVLSEYRSAFKKLDCKFAHEVVGDEDSPVVGPFSAAQAQFFQRHVIPLCAGAFGEIGEDFSKILKTLARQAAASNDGLVVSPLVNSDRKGGAFPIMQQQFRRAIGVAIVRGNALHKLARLHYVRATAREAAYAARANHSDNRWRPGDSGGPSWFRQHTAEGYGVFEQFRNGYDFSVH